MGAESGTLSITSVLTRSWAVFKACWLPFSGIMLLAGVLAAIAVGILFFGCILAIEAMPSEGGGGFYISDSQTVVMGITLALMAAASFAILQVGAAAVAFGTLQQMRAQPADFKRCVNHGFAVMAPVSGVALLVGLITGIPAAALAVLGTIADSPIIFVGLVLAPLIAVPFLVAVPAAALERKGVSSALARSIELTRGNYGRLLGILLLMAAAYVAIMTLLGTAMDVIISILMPFSLAAFLAYGTFAAVVAAVLYLELRRVKEGIGAEEAASLFD
ncbi:MAG: hypothetical protein ACKVOI_19195 [Dongiaceae bacterium]